MQSSSQGLDLRALFEPASVAVIGASSRLERVAGRPLAFLREWGFPGAVAAVNPGAGEIAGFPSYPTLADVPFVPELAIVCRPAEDVLRTLEECVDRGVRAAVVFASGFSEIAGGCADEPAIRALAARSGLAVCGPNGLGVINAARRLPATFSNVLAATELPAGDIGFATHSGALGIYLYAEAARRGLGFSAWASTGNEAGITFADVVTYLAADPATRVVCGYLEGARDAASLRRALATAREAGTPVVVVKGGRSASGSQAAASHTAALAGDAAVWSGILAQDGAIEVDDAVELLDVAAILRLAPRLDPARGVAIGTTSGGGAILFADWCERLGLRLARLADATVEQVRDTIPPFGIATNPVDFTGNLMNDTGMVGRVVSIVADDPDVTATVVFVGVAGEMGERVVDGLLAAERPPRALVCVVWIGVPDELRQRLTGGGVAVFADVASCVRALARALAWASRAAPPARAVAQGDTTHRGSAAGAHDPERVLPEWRAKRLLADLGLRVPPGTLVRGAVPADMLVGGPYAVKGQAPGVVHKAAAGLVRLWVAGHEVESAVREVAGADGALVEEMVPAGIELLVTLRRDATFGWVVIVGAGGTLAELLDDVVVRACPLDAAAAAAAVSSLRIAAQLDGEALQVVAGLVASLSRCPGSLPADLDELELNPVTISGDGAVILDAVGFLRRP